MSIVSSLTRVSTAALMLIGLTGVSTATLAAEKAAKPGVVIQVSENNPAVWNLALNNAKNVQQDMGGKDKVDVEIVAYGPGINMLKFDSPVAPRLKEANNSGIQVSACANTMKKGKLSEKDLDGNVKIVPAGVIQIMKRQQEGWSYIRP
jgi:uncharacterized protein